MADTEPIRAEHTGRARRGEGHLLRAAILDATVELMAGVDDATAVSVRAVADRVGKTVPALYQHFPDKAALLTAASLHAIDAMGRAVGDEIADETDRRVRLRRRAHAFVRFAVDHPAPYQYLFMGPPERTGRPDTLDVLMTTVGFSGVVADLAEARAAGQMIDEDPEQVALALFTSIHGVASLLISHPALSWPADLLDRVLDQHAFGLVPRS